MGDFMGYFYSTENFLNKLQVQKIFKGQEVQNRRFDRRNPWRYPWEKSWEIPMGETMGGFNFKTYILNFKVSLQNSNPPMVFPMGISHGFSYRISRSILPVLFLSFVLVFSPTTLQLVFIFYISPTYFSNSIFYIVLKVLPRFLIFN